MARTENDEQITITVDQGCIECPFSGDTGCGASPLASTTHDFSFHHKCPLLIKTILVKFGNEVGKRG